MRLTDLASCMARVITAHVALFNPFNYLQRKALPAAAEALGTTGAVPTGMALQRFRELDARVVDLIEHIQQILG